MASSNSATPLPGHETTSKAATGSDGKEETLTDRSSCSTHLHSSNSNIPEIPDIPSPLLRPPKVKSAVVLATTQKQTASPEQIKNKESHENLDSVIRSQVGRQVDRVFSDAVKDFQGQLISKAKEVDQLRVDLQNMELRDEEMFSRFLKKPESPVKTTFSTSQFPSVSTTFVGPVRTGGLGARTAGYSTIPGTGNTGSVFGLRESSAQTDDLRRKLKMTTELCAKQDAYYREVVSELENRLKETIAGRDHVLALRENEAAGQLQLIHQLEASLRKQQQIIEEKDEVLNSTRSSVKNLEEDLVAHKSFLDKIRRIALEEDKKRFRSGLITSALENTLAVGQFGDALVELIQKCLFDDDKEKKALQSTLERVEAELKSNKELSDNKLEELQKEYKARISKLEEEHNQALELSANRGALVRKELKALKEETDKLKEQHQIEVSAMENKVKSLEVELDKTRKTSYETTVPLEAKCKELECSVRELKTELQVAKEEQQSLFTRLSQEQANVITLNEKLSTAEKYRLQSAEKTESLSKELTILRDKHNEETNSLRDIVSEKEQLVKEIRLEMTKLRDSEVEKAINEEKEKSNTRLDGILNELTKSNHNMSNLTANLQAKEAELSKQHYENVKMKSDLELRTKEINLIREEKLHLVEELEKRRVEVSDLQRQLEDLKTTLELKAKGLLEAESCVEKLHTQLNEREKTIASFQAQGTNLAEIIERNSQTGDSLQREREQLIRTLEERISEVEEMKSHREILAKKLRAKDKRVKELEEEKTSMSDSLKIKQEELDALMEDRSNIMAELKLRQVEVTKLKDENSSLSSLVEGKHGEREKEISKLLSRLKGSEQDLALTRKLLKTKGDMSGKAVRVAESMQQEVTAKRGELDALQNKVHWLTESLNTAAKDARYYEKTSSELSETVKQLTVDRDQLEFELKKSRQLCDAYKKQLNHMEQALEKAALKHAESQGVIEKMEQEMARLKLKHSLEIKEIERTAKAPVSVRPDAASLVELLTKLNSGFRWPPLTTQGNYGTVYMTAKDNPTLLTPAPSCSQPMIAELETRQLPHSAQSVETSEDSSKKNEEVTDDLKTLLHEVRSLISSFQAHVSLQTVTPVRGPETAMASQGPPERGPLDDAPVHPSEPDNGVEYQTTVRHVRAPQKVNSEGTSEGKRRGEEPNSKHHKNQLSKEHMRPRPVVYSKQEQELDRGSVSSLTTDLNSRISSNSDGDDIEEFALPLHSSSPKKDSIASSEIHSDFSQTLDKYSPLSASSNSSDSDVSSLLIDQTTSTGDTVISRDGFNTAHYNWKSRSSASSVSSSQRSSSKKSDEVQFLKTRSRPALQDPQAKQHNDVISSRHLTMHGKQDKPSLGKQVSSKSDCPQKEPVYRRAEMILQSLALTGEQLTKKNREIEHLLKEQDKRIKKCRKNENNIQALLL